MFKLGWVVPGVKESINSFVKYGQKLTHVSPTWLRFDSNADLHLTVTEEEIHRFLEIAKEKKVKVVPLVVNERFDEGVAGSILGNKKMQEKAAEQLVKFAEKYQVDGVNLDFEGVFGLWRYEYTEFVGKVSEELHRLGKEVSVDVVCQTAPPKSIDDLKENMSGNFEEIKKMLSWADSYDYEGLGKLVDQFILMGYDYHAMGSEPGPVGPLWWIRDVLDYTLKIVDKNKVVLGLPFYGRGWTSIDKMRVEDWEPRNPMSREPMKTAFEAGFELGKAYDYREIKEKSRYFIKSGINPEENSPWGVWELEDGKMTIVYYDDLESLKKKISLVREYELLGIAFWRLGHEDERIWDVL